MDEVVQEEGSASDTPPAGALPLAGGAVLAGHLVYVSLQALLFANVWLVPLLVRLHFGSADEALKDWQTMLVTAAVPVCLMFSIFWNELLSRVRLRTYLAIFWLAAIAPLGAIGLVHSYGQLVACHLLAAVGLAGNAPLNGLLLRHFYRDRAWGRIYALLSLVTLGVGASSAALVGQWLERVPDAFRMYLPATAGVQIPALALLAWLGRRTRLDPRGEVERHSWATLVKPVLHMGEVLRRDRIFQRYERAFMTYGAAFMLCDVLLPVLATHQLGMRYKDYAEASQVVLRGVMLVLMLPMGWLLDRIGAVRISSLAFGVLAGYPLLLLAAGGVAGLGLATAVYGIGMAGVQMSWMLGPVALAGSPDKVPQYVAIHATLVGVRGILFQCLGMALYRLTGSFTWPLLLASAAFAWAAAQMVRLHAIQQQARQAAEPSPALAGGV